MTGAVSNATKGWERVALSEAMPVPNEMRAWVLGDPEELSLTTKPVQPPGKAEALVRIDAVAICATDLEVIRYGTPALIEGGPPFNKNFSPGHEYMGTIAALGPGVDEFQIGDRDPRRLRPVQTLPDGHVHLLP